MNISELYRAVNAIAPVNSGVNGPNTQGGKPLSGPSDFQKALTEVQLSKHAETRIRSRALPWTGEIQKRIGDGIDVAREKGSQSALILADEIAVIANVKSRTVVTALDPAQLKHRVFTNIDSAVIV